MTACKVLRAATLAGVEVLVRTWLDRGDGWSAQGQPFWCSEDRQWCWAIVQNGTKPAQGEIKLREPSAPGIGEWPKRKR
jgi:hypothetical protein